MGGLFPQLIEMLGRDRLTRLSLEFGVERVIGRIAFSPIPAANLMSGAQQRDGRGHLFAAPAGATGRFEQALRELLAAPGQPPGIAQLVADRQALAHRFLHAGEVALQQSHPGDRAKRCGHAPQFADPTTQGDALGQPMLGLVQTAAAKRQLAEPGLSKSDVGRVA